MDEARLARLIEGLVGPDLAPALVGEFVKIRRDYATRTLERSSIGKFVEIFVQCLQQIASAKYETKPTVDDYLLKHAETNMALPEGLRICAARAARAMYTLRNKRSIAHANEIDPNAVDLALGHQAATWILAELIRNATGITMEDAGAAINLLQVPVGTLVEDGQLKSIFLKTDPDTLLKATLKRWPATTYACGTAGCFLGNVPDGGIYLRNFRLRLFGARPIRRVKCEWFRKSGK